MASEEQYLDDLLKSMMDNKPDSMEDAMQDMNKAENKPSDFSTEDLNSMLDELEHTGCGRRRGRNHWSACGGTD